MLKEIRTSFSFSLLLPTGNAHMHIIQNILYYMLHIIGLYKLAILEMNTYIPRIVELFIPMLSDLGSGLVY